MLTLKMLVQHIQNAVCHSPQKEERRNQNKRNQEIPSVPGSYQSNFLHVSSKTVKAKIAFVFTVLFF